MAKSLIAATITLNPAAAHHGPGSYTIRPGDTLSQIAARAYCSGADWPAIWWANRGQVPDPDLIPAGQRLALPSSHRVPPWLARAALAAAAAARPVPAAPAGATAAPAGPALAVDVTVVQVFPRADSVFWRAGPSPGW
jgi:nucleoid-associated protein YgaU